jgi:hypothetical protein
MRGAAKAETRAVALAVALRLLALVATSPAEAAGRYKTVTKTFSNLGRYRPPTPASRQERPRLAVPLGALCISAHC